jgi:hypothetical protein
VQIRWQSDASGLEDAADLTRDAVRVVMRLPSFSIVGRSAHSMARSWHWHRSVSSFCSKSKTYSAAPRRSIALAFCFGLLSRYKLQDHVAETMNDMAIRTLAARTRCAGPETRSK